METITTPVLKLEIPCSAEYVSVVRLAVLGLCSRTQMPYDEVEDLRLAVGEACSDSINRAEAAEEAQAWLIVTGFMTDDEIRIDIADTVKSDSDIELPVSEFAGDTEFDDYNDQSFRLSLIQLLVDSVDLVPGENGQKITMTKQIQRL